MVQRLPFADQLLGAPHRIIDPGPDEGIGVVFGDAPGKSFQIQIP